MTPAEQFAASLNRAAIILDDLQAAVACNFGIDPDNVTWADVGDINQFVAALGMAREQIGI